MRSWKPIATALAAVGLGAAFVVAAPTASAATGTLGYPTVGSQVDTDNANHLSGSRFTMGAADGEVTSMSVRVGSVGAAPNNKFEVGIYTDSGNRPGTLVASSATGTLQANDWNTIAVTAQLTANTPYWLMYNTNAGSGSLNNMRYNGGGTSTFSSSSTPFGTWPATFSSAPPGGLNFSIYATYTAADPPPPPPLSESGPGGPVLVIGSSANMFTTYYAEILKAEGINYYRIVDIANVTASTLSGYDVTILGEVPLTDTQAAMLSTWVDGGGQLIAMRPDDRLAGLLGLTPTTNTLSDAYLKINNTSGPGAGIVGTPIQYHSPADLWTLNGATAVATLYSDINSPTSNPAVTIRAVGAQGGHAAAFTYDLARSVVLTRQGNVAWSGQERDGVDGYQAHEMFIGGPSGVPDWNNLDQAIIPIADEQQRLLANLVLQMNQAEKPLPRFWYFPRGEKAVIIMTGDDHAALGATAARFEQYIAASPAGCDVANWDCVRSTSYVYTQTPLTNAQAVSYHNQGFEVGLHVTSSCHPWGSPENMAQEYEEQLDAWRGKYTGLPSPVSNRTHCVEWDDWASQAKVELDNGIRLDTNYYYYPSTWVQNRPGYFNGTAQIMRFADLDGSTIDVYQATTQMTDESGQTYPFTVDTLLDKALGPEGYYAALTANMHTDSAPSPASDAIIDAAQERGVPVVAARQMLAWLDARNAAAYQSISWNGTALSFNVTGGTNGLRGMLPMISTAGTLSTLTSGGNPVPFTTQTIKGVSYAFFPASTGGYLATYAAGDVVSPTVVGSTPAGGATGVSVNAPVSVRFSEAMAPATITTSTVELRVGGTGGPLVNRTVSYDSDTNAAVITPAAALTSNTGYTVVVKGSPGVTDAAGNQLAADHTFGFTTAAASTGILGHNQIGATLDSGATNHMNGSRFVTGPGGQTVSTMAVYARTVAAAPNNQYQVAIYADNAGVPGARIASSTTGTLVPNSWNTRPIAASLAANTAYWLMYNTNGDNNLSYDAGSANQSAWQNASQPFGTWPASFGAATRWAGKYSIYAFDDGGVDPPPTVLETVPAAGATGASTTAPVTVRFSEAMAPATITATNLELRLGGAGGTLVDRGVSYDSGTHTATITPAAALANSTGYTVVVRGNPGVTDLAGVPMAANHTFGFTTAAAGSGVFGYNQVGATLDSGATNHMNGSRFVTGPGGQTVNSLSVYLKTVVAAPNNQYQVAIYADNGGVPGARIVASTSGTLTANSWNTRPIATTSLAGSTAYWLMYNTNGDNNLSYDAGSANQSAWQNASQPFGTWPATFGTATRWAGRYSIYASTESGDQPPTVIGTTPPAGSTSAATTAPVTVQFSEPMAAATITTTNLELRTAGGTLVDRSVSYDSGTNSAVITPAAPLANSASYTVTVRGNPGVTDAGGAPLAGNHQFSFTTAAAGGGVFGYNQIGATLDSGAMNHLNGSRFVTGPAEQTVTSISVYLKTVAANNQYQVAIYADNAGVPGALIVSSTSGTLTANSWNSRPITPTVLSAGTAYWLMYNTNGNNNLSYDAGSPNQSAWQSAAQAFGSWPAVFGTANRWAGRYSIYAS